MPMTETALLIDGSQGEGGGQVLRSSLTLSLVTGRPVVLENIRAKRKKPGLMAQHLTAVRAAAEVGRAELSGAQLGATRLEFRPGPVQSGNYAFNVGTAGSCTLVLQTVLPALLSAKGPSHMILEGGTHNPLAPPFDFLAKAYLPLLRQMGPRVKLELVRPGFYPAGGGLVTARVLPAPRWNRLELLERGRITARRVRALIARLPRHIAERECRTIARLSGWSEESFTIEEVRNSRGPGNAVMIELESENVTEVFSAFGQLGVKAEVVAERAWRETQAYLAADVPVGPHLADQLMLPLAIGVYLGGGGGTFRTMPLTPHSTTHLQIIRTFLGVEARVKADTSGNCRLSLG
jgi:RNA 3'-terminal phosphate cyclase (ATP)